MPVTKEEILNKFLGRCQRDTLAVNKNNALAAMDEWAAIQTAERDARIAELKKSKWIDVNERLPELHDFVLTYNTEGATLIGRLYPNGWTLYFSDGEKAAEPFGPTHWQHLPEPPTKLLTDKK